MQLRRSIPEPRFLAQALYVVHMIALHCPSVMEAASASWPSEGFASLFKFLTPGVDPAVRQAAAGAISVILSQHVHHPSIKDVIVGGSIKLKGLLNAFGEPVCFVPRPFGFRDSILVDVGRIYISFYLTKVVNTTARPRDMIEFVASRVPIAWFSVPLSCTCRCLSTQHPNLNA